MAVKKATTTGDLTTEDVTAQAEDLTSTREDIVAGVVEGTDDSVLAKVDGPKTYKVKAPSGETVEVPESILDALLESGYSKTK